jgi:hypothetical protein
LGSNSALQEHEALSRAAVVADQKWIELFTKMAKPFLSGEIRYFKAVDTDEARSWPAE